MPAHFYLNGPRSCAGLLFRCVGNLRYIKLPLFGVWENLRYIKLPCTTWHIACFAILKMWELSFFLSFSLFFFLPSLRFTLSTIQNLLVPFKCVDFLHFFVIKILKSLTLNFIEGSNSYTIEPWSLRACLPIICFGVLLFDVW